MEAIKHQRVREQNKLASQKSRFVNIDPFWYRLKVNLFLATLVALDFTPVSES